MAILNYLWVGRPSERGPDGHDVAGPIAMAAAVDPHQVIQFWCIGRYVPTYEAIFQGTRVRVRHIEHFIDSCGALKWWTLKARPAWAASRVACALRQVLMMSGISEAENPNIRDLIYFKDLFSFFVLYFQGGYTLDTNVLPMAGRTPRFRDFSDMRAPIMEDRRAYDKTLYHVPVADPTVWFGKPATTGAVWVVRETLEWLHRQQLEQAQDASFLNFADDVDYPVAKVPLLDCWMMYSPQYGESAWNALEYYIRSWPSVCMSRRHGLGVQFDAGNPDEDGSMLHMQHEEAGTSTVGSAVYNGLMRQRGGGWRGPLRSELARPQWETREVPGTDDPRSGIFEMPAFGVYKVYLNTHRRVPGTLTAATAFQAQLRAWTERAPGRGIGLELPMPIGDPMALITGSRGRLISVEDRNRAQWASRGPLDLFPQLLGALHRV